MCSSDLVQLATRIQKVVGGPRYAGKQGTDIVVAVLDQLSRCEKTTQDDHGSRCYGMAAKVLFDANRIPEAEAYMLKAIQATPEFKELIRIQQAPASK